MSIRSLFYLACCCLAALLIASCGGSSESVAQKATEKALKERMTAAQKEAAGKIDGKRFAVDQKTDFEEEEE